MKPNKIWMFKIFIHIYILIIYIEVIERKRDEAKNKNRNEPVVFCVFYVCDPKIWL